MTISTFTLGSDRLDLNPVGLTDEQLLKEAKEAYPQGFCVGGNNQTPVWIHPKLILGLASPDGFGIEFVGFAHVAAELIRLACDPLKADTLGEAGCDRLIAMFVAQAETMAEGKAANQLHAVRFGVGAKVVAADRVEPGTIEVHPAGRVAKALAQVFCTHGADDWEDSEYLGIEGETVHVVRHPFLMVGSFRIGFNDKLSKNTVLMNRYEVRKKTKCDFDGDTINLFPNEDAANAAAIDEAIADAVPDHDPTLLVRGLSADSAEAEMWGENIFADGKTTEKKLGQSFAKSVDEWILSHVKMGECANTYTPFAYRISDVCALMASIGLGGAREAAMIGAVVEEDYYLGLAGGPDGMDAALTAWMRNQLGSDTQRSGFFAGMIAGGAGVDADLITQDDVQGALLDAALINKQGHDPFDPYGALVHLGWLVGKGRVTTDPKAAEKLDILAKLADEPAGKDLADTFLGAMAFFAARKLAPILALQPQEEEYA